MKGDRVEIVIAADDGSRTHDIRATRSGRRVADHDGPRDRSQVTEVTRTGEPVRRARFMASRVLALVDTRRAKSGAGASPPRARRRAAPSASLGGRRIQRS